MSSDSPADAGLPAAAPASFSNLAMPEPESTAEGGAPWGAWQLDSVNQEAVHAPALATLRCGNLETVLQRVRTTLRRHEEDIRSPAWLDGLRRQIDAVQANVDVLSATVAAQAQLQSHAAASAHRAGCARAPAVSAGAPCELPVSSRAPPASSL